MVKTHAARMHETPKEVIKNIILKNAAEDRVQIAGVWEAVLQENKAFGARRG